MWNIHGKEYDLTNFLHKHPGGKKILESCKGIHDLTPAFESYHAFCDRDKIQKIMAKYEVVNDKSPIPNSKYTFDTNGFYKTLVRRVRPLYDRNKSKGTIKWMMIGSVTALAWLISFYLAFIYNNNYFIAIISSAVSGTALMQLLLQVYHDTSHSSGFVNQRLNEIVGSIIASLALWDANIWYKHHSIKHHSFTGEAPHDPDSIYGLPVFAKTNNKPPSKIKNPYIIPIYLTFIPGLYVGQIIKYITGYITGRLWEMTIRKDKLFIEWLLMGVMAILMINRKSIMLPFIYLLFLNINYCISVLPDHDMLETHNNLSKTATDWGEIQVRNSGNFGTKNMLYTRLYGSINYQIEHHLFPSMCSIHLPDIQPIVKATCREFNVPYVDNPSILNAYLSCMRNIQIINNP